MNRRGFFKRIAAAIAGSAVAPAADVPLSLASLQDALITLKKQTDLNGLPINPNGIVTVTWPESAATISTFEFFVLQVARVAEA